MVDAGGLVWIETSRNEIRTCDIETGQVTRWAHDVYNIGTSQQSPNGRYIAYSTTCYPYPTCAYYLLDLESGEKTQLTDGWHPYYGPFWTHDSKHLFVGKGAESGDTESYLFSVRTGEIHKVPHPPCGNLSPSPFPRDLDDLRR